MPIDEPGPGIDGLLKEFDYFLLGAFGYTGSVEGITGEVEKELSGALLARINPIDCVFRDDFGPLAERAFQQMVGEMRECFLKPNEREKHKKAMDIVYKGTLLTAFHLGRMCKEEELTNGNS